jgi:hypothetical protein
LDSAIRDAADREGSTRADWVRRALREALDEAS